MEKETLVLERTETKTEEKTVEISPKRELKRESINLFSIKRQVAEVVEKPNYDQIEELPPEKRKKIFKVEKELSADVSVNKKDKRFKLIIFGVIVCLFGAFFISNTVNIIKTTQALQNTGSSYSASLKDLMQRIYSTESGNRAMDLFETYPEEELPISSIADSSNWFDRFCNFFTRLFGG